jgi:hypothetical protein
MLVRILTLGVLLSCLHSSTALAADIELTASVPRDAGRSAGVFFSASGMQAVGDVGLWGLDRAGVGLAVLIPTALVWPSISALVAWAVGDASPYYRASYGAMFVGSYLGLAAAGAVALVASAAMLSSAGFAGLGFTLFFFRLAWTIGPAAGQAIAYARSRRAEDDLWRRNLAR